MSRFTRREFLCISAALAISMPQMAFAFESDDSGRVQIGGLSLPAPDGCDIRSPRGFDNADDAVVLSMDDLTCTFILTAYTTKGRPDDPRACVLDALEDYSRDVIGGTDCPLYRTCILWDETDNVSGRFHTMQPMEDGSGYDIDTRYVTLTGSHVVIGQAASILGITQREVYDAAVETCDSIWDARIYLDEFENVLDDTETQKGMSDDSNGVRPVEVTLGMQNALNQAANYLQVMAFSREGLIQQLEYEGYSHEEAVYGVDNVGADWNEQAALKADDYISIMSFSRSGLIEQLEYEGFTVEQAEYGATAIGY